MGRDGRLIGRPFGELEERPADEVRPLGRQHVQLGAEGRGDPELGVGRPQHARRAEHDGPRRAVTGQPHVDCRGARAAPQAPARRLALGRFGADPPRTRLCAGIRATHYATTWSPQRRPQGAACSGRARSPAPHGDPYPRRLSTVCPSQSAAGLMKWSFPPPMLHR